MVSYVRGKNEAYTVLWDRKEGGGSGSGTSGESLESRVPLLAQTPLWISYGARSLGGQFANGLEATL